MAIEKFRFVSPGVQVNEIDESIIPEQLPTDGPVIIGNTAKGPAMQPVMVSSVAELEKIFGSTSNGNVGATDVWRTGAPTSPTLATYAARAFLQNSSPVTVIRLAGVENTGDVSLNPGWSSDAVQQIFAVSGTTGVLLANLYTKTGTSVTLQNGLSGTVSNKSFDVTIGTQLYKISVDSGKQSFIRNVLNTNPSRYSDEGYFLGESFENSLSGVSGFTQVFLETRTADFNDFKDSAGAKSAFSPVVVDDLVSGSNTYNKLFHFEGLNNGSSLSKDIKISIESVKPSKNLAVTKYGTFDVVVRKVFETSGDTALERFSNLTLDPKSDSYICRVIGDSYRKWNSTNERYEEYGTYANRSSYIRVVMANEDVPATALPHGFLMKGVPDFSDITEFTASHANVPLFTDSIAMNAAKYKRFGLKADKLANADLVDILSYKPESIDLVDEDKLFHTRYINKVSNNVVYLQGTYSDHDILTAEGTLNGSISGSIKGFDMPMYHGFDAKDITKIEPFIDNGALAGTSELTSPQYKAIKQAIDIIALPEVIDMNMLCIPGLQNSDLTDYMLEVCRSRGDSLALIDLKGDYLYSYENGGTEYKPQKIANVVENLLQRNIDNSYGAAYFPAVFVPSEGIFLPASVAALGAIGGTEGRQALWFAPAGFNRGGLNVTNSGISVSRTAMHLISSDRDSLYDSNINPIATFPNEGVVIFGQKTLQSTPSALDRVNVRRLVNYIKKQVSRAATRVLFEPNVEATWNSFRSVVEPFLLAIKNGFGLDDAKVELDETTTTADLVDRNIMYCKIYLKPTRAIEYIAIDFIVTNSGAAFTDNQ